MPNFYCIDLFTQKSLKIYQILYFLTICNYFKIAYKFAEETQKTELQNLQEKRKPIEEKVRKLEKCKLATIQITRKFNNFLDYNPYTKIEIDVPFTSPVELNPVDVYGKTIEVYCIPDFNTGKGTIYIQNDDRILYITQATISVDIPLGTTNAVENLRNQVNNLLNLGSGVAQGIIGASSGNPFGIAQGLGLVSSALVNGVNNNIIHYTSKGTGSGVGNMYSPLKVYSVIRTPKVKTITQYNHLYGKPLMSYERLDQTHGYTEIEEIHLEYIDKALQTEIDEIRALLKQGVILP